MDKQIKTRETNINLFKKYVNKYINFFGMFDWEINFAICHEKNADASCAYYRLDEAGEGCGQTVTFRYSLDWIDSNVEEDEIERTAFHEVLELLLSKLRDFSSYKDVHISDREVDNEIHRVIRIFENKVFNLVK
jgi:hypothetical protein